MFNKDKNNYKSIDIKVEKLYQHNDILLSDSMIEIIDKVHNSKQIGEKNDYQIDITTYIKKKNENSAKKQYNPKITNLYYNGIIVIDSEEYSLKDFFIVFDSKLNNFHIKCINPKYKSEEIEYNKAVKFIDTTAFIQLIDKSTITNNKIIVNNLVLKDVVNNWDGYLHSEVLETDAIINKRMIEDDKNE